MFRGEGPSQRGDSFPPSPHTPRPVPGAEPRSPPWEEPPPTGLRGGGLPTAGMSPQKPPGESAVASLWVENPKVAPAWGRRRGREAGLLLGLGASPGLGRPSSPRRLPWREEGSLAPRGLPWVWLPLFLQRLQASKGRCRSGAPPASGAWSVRHFQSRPLRPRLPLVFSGLS